LEELVAAARPPVVPPPEVVGGWLPSHSEGDGGWEDGGAPEPEPVRQWSRRHVPPAAAAAALVLAAAVGLLVWLRSADAGHVMDVPARPARVLAGPSAAGSPTSLPLVTASMLDPSGVASPGTSPPGALLVVDVEGRVRRPGLVHLPAGSRVADAVRSAGGASPGAVLARLNLARVLTDGEQLLVPGPGDPVAPSVATGTSGAVAGSSGPVDLNAATQEGLDALPGVGPVLAARIVAWRTAHGRFTSVDELGEVPGIGPKALERLRPLVRV
jgi:competence protein ComEA